MCYTLGMDDEMSAPDFCRLLDVSLETLSDLAERGILVPGATPSSYLVEPSIQKYCRHLREQSLGTSETVVEKSKRTKETTTKPHDVSPAHAEIEARQTTVPGTRYRLFGMTAGNIRSFQRAAPTRCTIDSLKRTPLAVGVA